MKKKIDKKNLEKIDKLTFTIEEEAKAIVLWSFRNNPTLENIHEGEESDIPDNISRIKEEEMKKIMKYAVDEVSFYLWLKMKNPLSIFGIFILLVTLSFSGCLEVSDNEDSSNNGDHTNDNIISFYDLDNELYKYADKEISIEGNILWILGKSWNKSTYVGKLKDWDYSGLYIDLIIPTDINVLHCLDYTIAGIVREPETYGDNPIIEVNSAKLDQSLPDDERWWASKHGLSFVEEYISTQSEYADWSETGMGYVHHGVFNSTIDIGFHTEDDKGYTNTYTVLMELNENSDMTEIDSWKLLSIDEEVDIWDHIPDI